MDDTVLRSFHIRVVDLPSIEEIFDELYQGLKKYLKFKLTLVIAGHHNLLCGGMSAPQNLQRALSRLLIAGTTWSLLHLGHLRLR